jgi:hypothetical protein
MAWRDTIAYWWERAVPILGLIVLIAVAIAIVVFVPGRGAAALLGVMAGAGLGMSLMSRARQSVRVAVLWAGLAVAADASYARLNDQAPVTLANGLARAVDAIAKLAEPLIRGFGVADPRAKIAAAAPDFVWALILSLILVMALAFTFYSSAGRYDYRDKLSA